VAVVGDPEQRHGIILTKNQIAKNYGIQTGEAIWQAQQKCPNLVTVPARYDLYMQFSKAARRIYEDYTDQIEPFGLDESWCDLTGSIGLLGSGKKVADEIRQRIKYELGITASVGVSFNKVFAKLGSDYRKPDYTTVIARENYRNIVWPLPASDLLYVGRATTRKLSSCGIHTIGQLAEMRPDFLKTRFGKWGEYLWAFANGKDLSPVAKMDANSAVKSIGNSMTTWRDVVRQEEAWQVLLALSESVARRLRENAFRCKTVQISLRDNELLWFERQTKLPVPTCTVKEIAMAAMHLVTEHYAFQKPLRSLGVRACDLIGEDCGYQTGFFDGTEKQVNREKIETCVDKLRSRFGNKTIVRATLLDADIVGESDPLTHEVHPIGFFR
jgi:DNA polymerase-4